MGDLATAIMLTARTDRVGDGNILVRSVMQAIRIRTGEIDAPSI